MDSYTTSQPPVRQFATISYGDPLGYVQFTLTTAVNLPTIPAGANHVVVQTETGDIRYRDDTVAPTASVGMYLFAGNYVELQSEKVVQQFKLIAVTGSVVVNVSYYHKNG